MSDDNITHLPKNFREEQALYDDILEAIDSYQGKLSIVSVIGILNLAQDEIKKQAQA